MMFLATEGIGAACRWFFRLDGFRTSWDTAFKTSLEDLHFHDLRRTAVTRLALSNCSLPKIASIDAHDLGSRVELAESVVKKLSQVYEHK